MLEIELNSAIFSFFYTVKAISNAFSVWVKLFLPIQTILISMMYDKLQGTH